MNICKNLNNLLLAPMKERLLRCQFINAARAHGTLARRRRGGVIPELQNATAAVPVAADGLAGNGEVAEADGTHVIVGRRILLPPVRPVAIAAFPPRRQTHLLRPAVPLLPLLPLLPFSKLCDFLSR